VVLPPSGIVPPAAVGVSPCASPHVCERIGSYIASSPKVRGACTPDTPAPRAYAAEGPGAHGNNEDCGIWESGSFGCDARFTVAIAPTRNPESDTGCE